MAAQDGRSSQQNRRGDRGRATTAGPLFLAGVLAVGCVAGYAWHATKRADPSAALENGITATTAPPDDSADSADPGDAKARSDQPSAAGRTAGARNGSTPSRTKGRPSEVPISGTGSFSTAHASAPASGHGTIRRYKVQVEGGIALSSSDAAHEIAAILADPRGWTADGHDGFQLISSGPADFVIKIATPDTVDDICGSAGLLTQGEVNCDVGPTVVVNLKRWLLGSPAFSGPIQDYRALIINHEVGHRIGHSHEGCPGPGELAPVMMQQIKGLHGCVANAWPYDRAGHYIQGPPAP